MDIILIFIILPLATIVFSIALQKILENPFLVAAIIFSTLLLGAYILFNGSINAIIGAIVYGVISLITAFIISIIHNLREEMNNNNNNNADTDDNDNNYINTRACRICRCQRNLLRNINR